MDSKFRSQEFKVVDIITPSRIVLNCGVEQGAKVGDRFQVYAHGKLIVDPDTNEAIEHLEIPRGPARVIYVQQKLCTIESTSVTHRTVKKEADPFRQTLGSIGSFLGTPIETETINVRVPFVEVQIGDRARYTGGGPDGG